MKPRDLVLLALLAAVTGCGALDQRESPENRAALKDCRAEADRVFDAQNRYQMSERDSSSTPYSGNALPNDLGAGLSDRYARDKMVDSCLARGATDTGTPSTATSP